MYEYKIIMWYPPTMNTKIIDYASRILADGTVETTDMNWFEEWVENYIINRYNGNISPSVCFELNLSNGDGTQIIAEEILQHL